MATNTLVITGLDRADFTLQINDYTNVDRLHQLITKNVPIVHWAPLKSFGRILAVFQSSIDAAIARQTLTAFDDAAVLLSMRNHNDTSFHYNKPHMQIKTYFYTNTPLYTNSDKSNEIGPLEGIHLLPPESPNGFFISPPPSPPSERTLQFESQFRINTPPSELLKEFASRYQNSSDGCSNSKGAIVNADALGDTLVNVCIQNLTNDSHANNCKDAAFSGYENLNGSEIDSLEFGNTLQAALLNLEQAQLKRQNSINSQDQDQDTETKHMSDMVVTTQMNENGKLTRRVTLHESNGSLSTPVFFNKVPTKEKQTPILSLKTDEKTLATTTLTDSSVIITPTIILEWEEEEEEDNNSNSNLHNSCWNQVGQAPVPLSIF